MNLQNYDNLGSVTYYNDLLRIEKKTETFTNQYLYFIAQRNVDKNNS